jgi:BR serine/threonine kinase
MKTGGGEGAPQPWVGPYLLSNTLGVGSSGKVKLGVHSDTGQRVAVKIIAKDTFTQRPDVKNKVQREIALMRLIDHPNILKLYDVLESHQHLYMILEYAEQRELFDYLVKRV